MEGISVLRDQARWGVRLESVFFGYRFDSPCTSKPVGAGMRHSQDRVRPTRSRGTIAGSALRDRHRRLRSHRTLSATMLAHCQPPLRGRSGGVSSSSPSSHRGQAAGAAKDNRTAAIRGIASSHLFTTPHPAAQSIAADRRADQSRAGHWLAADCSSLLLWPSPLLAALHRASAVFSQHLLRLGRIQHEFREHLLALRVLSL